MKKAIIIGSGFGSLALAVRLLATGWDVEIFEKNASVGGHAAQFKEKGYTFDMGPSLITMPEMIRDIFALLHENADEYLDFIKLDPFYRIYFHDKSFIDYSDDSDNMKSQMAQFCQKDADNYENFIEFSSKVYEAVITQGLGSEPFNKLFTMLEFVPQALKSNAFLPAYFQASRYFENFRHRFMFSFHPLFIGGNPFKVPSIYLMISYLEKKGGVWFTKGGMYCLVQAFADIIKKHGGVIHTSAPVEKVELQGRTAKGVIVKGNLHEADIVVSNADVTHTYKDLVPREEMKWSTKRLEKAKYAMSSYVLYLGVKKKYPELKHHTLILSHRYKELIKDIFDKHIIPDDFSMYLHVPSTTDSSMAPEGSESIYVLIPVSNLKADVDWNTFDALFTEKVINFLEHNFGMKGLSENIEVKRTFNPLDFKKVRNSYLGSPWGMEPILLQSAYFRAHNRSEDFENIFLVGAGTHPGAGLPGVMLSSMATLKLINEYKK